MIPDQYVWATWAGLFLLSWLALFALFPRCRSLMWWSSLLTLPFGLSEFFFLGRYWDPPSLFNLTRVCHCDVETFVFCFGIGGVAAAAFNIVTGRPILRRRMTEREATLAGLHALAFAAPIPIFAVVLWLTRGDLIWAGIGGMTTGALARVVSRPDLGLKVLFGGLLFPPYYIVFLLLLNVLAPGYLERYWNIHGPAANRAFGLPVTELLFACGFGLYLSGLCEQLDWLFSAPSRVASAPRVAELDVIKSKDSGR